MSSRVPGPTVNRRMPVNSGAARIGATTLCLHGCVLTQKMKNIVSCTEATCLSWRVVLKRHTPAVRLCGSSSHRKPTAGHWPSTVRKPRQPGPCTPSSWTAANAAVTPSRGSSLLKNCKNSALTSTARVRTSDPAIDKEFVECAFLRLAHGLHIQNNVWACSEPFRIPQPEPKPRNH